jgi:hypothetical protein
MQSAVGAFVLVWFSFRLGRPFTTVVVVSVVVVVSSICVALAAFCIVVRLFVLLFLLCVYFCHHLDKSHAINVKRFGVAVPSVA